MGEMGFWSWNAGGPGAQPLDGLSRSCRPFRHSRNQSSPGANFHVAGEPLAASGGRDERGSRMQIVETTLHHPPQPLPACGFKEWSMVCDALGAGAQSIILRKGGIHEGRSGFCWKHDAFFLFPTHFHEQSTQFPWPEGTPPAAADDSKPHTLTHFATVEWKAQLTGWPAVESLAPFHYWTEQTIRERFDYTEQAGISMALVRVWQLAQPWSFPHEAKYGGCRSWLALPEIPRDAVLTPVLNDARHAAVSAAVRAALSA
jgi:hypothetical protein